jgi:hypothetical protein
MNKPLQTTLASLILLSAPAFGAAVDLSVDAATDGIAGSLQGVLSGGVIEIGWLNPGVTQAQITNLFATNDLIAIDAVFNQVATIPFPSAAIDFDSGGGQYFENVTLVNDGDNAGLTAYKNVTTGAAGKDMFSWIRNSTNLASTTEMAFIDGVGVFPTANDVVNFTDFGATFAHSVPPAGTVAWVGSINPVIVGGQIDNLGLGNTAGDGLGATGSGFVLQLAQVPEPSTGILLLAGLGAFAARRRRA